MDQKQIEQEISVIKHMIERTRKETAESGHFFIAIGFYAILMVTAIGLLEYYQWHKWILRTLIAMPIVAGIIGYFSVTGRRNKELVKSYSKTIFYNLLFSYSIPTLMIVFLFPMLKTYSWSAVPILVSLFMGIMVISVGIIFEIRLITLFSFVWWLGAFLMAVYANQQWIRLSTMILCLTIGFIIPGFILNFKYKNGSTKNEP
jgi:hypothetical protein